MRAKTIKKEEADLTKQFQSQYDKECRAYQTNYNRTHPGAHIWRHLIYTRTIHFLRQGSDVTCLIRIVRFIIAGTNKSFTFYGSFILPRTHYSLPMLWAWIRQTPPLLSPTVIRRWKSATEAESNPFPTSQTCTAANGKLF